MTGRVLGIGSLWGPNGLATREGSSACQYNGPNAIREYQALSGCSDKSPPIDETIISPFDECGVWDDGCFGRELMSAIRNPGPEPRPISRMTIGSLDDMGYQVNYAEADPFSGADMNPSCRCDYNRRMLRSSSSSRRSRRRLSSRGKEEATSFGLEQLEQMNHEIVSRNESALLANQLVVYYVEDEVVYDVVVRNDVSA